LFHPGQWWRYTDEDKINLPQFSAQHDFIRLFFYF